MTSAVPVAAAPTPALAAVGKYREALRSTLLMGGSSALNMLIGLVRTKALAVLLGPAGFGLMGVYALIADMTRSLAQLGINDSGVRQIAAAVATGDDARIARTVTVLRRVAVLCGLLGVVLLLLLARRVSVLTFGDEDHAGAVAWLALAVFLSLVAGGQIALVQGLRRISDLAWISTLGALLSLCTSVLLVAVLRMDGLVPAIISGAAVSIVTAWWYSRRIEIAATGLSAAQFWRESASLLTLGVSFMVSGLLTLGAAWAVRAMVLRSAGLEAAGHYHAAWTLGGLYVGFILQALGVDFYPRLVGVAADDVACNLLVNEQTLLCLLLAAPGVLATLTGARLAVEWFYSAQFVEAASLLRWICLGMALRIITWPIGYIIVARNRQRLFVTIELAWTVVYLGLTWLGVQAWGIDGAGMALCASYVLHAALVYPAVRRLSGFRWSGVNLRTGGLFVLAIATVSGGFQMLTPAWATGLGALMTLLATLHCTRSIVRLVEPARWPRLLAWLPAARRPPH